MRNQLRMAVAAIFIGAITVLAAGYGSSGNSGATAGGSSGSVSTSPATHKCRAGQVWNKQKQKCLKATGGILPDHKLFEQGHALAKEPLG